MSGKTQSGWLIAVLILIAAAVALRICYATFTVRKADYTTVQSVSTVPDSIIAADTDTIPKKQKSRRKSSGTAAKNRTSAPQRPAVRDILDEPVPSE